MHAPREMVTPHALPDAVESWHYVCASRELPRGRTIAWALPGLPLVIYRGAAGTAYALGAHCLHMGAHLVHGEVIDDRLRCPMHHWTYAGDGRCVTARGASARQAAFPVVECDGALFVFAGSVASFPLPRWYGRDLDLDRRAGSEVGWRVVSGRPVRIDTAWQTIALNAFDVRHLETVHQRALRKPPVLQAIGDHGIELRYASRVTGQSIADRVMQRLARDRVCVTIQCWGGNLLVVRSEAGRFVNHLLLCLTPTRAAAAGATSTVDADDRGVLVTPRFAVPRTRVPGLDWLRGWTTRWLFTSFLARDLEPLRGMRLRTAGAFDEPGPLAAFAQWLAARPAIEPSACRPFEPDAHDGPHVQLPSDLHLGR